MKWIDLKDKEKIFLYAGGVPESRLKYVDFVGLSLFDEDDIHIRHDVTEKMPIGDNTVDIYQSEDVFEHINYFKLLPVVNEIHRVLKPGGLFRLSVPDYRCDELYNRSMKDEDGNILFDGLGGGAFINGREYLEVHGHVWYPKYETVKLLLFSSNFTDIRFLHYYSETGKPVTKKIDYSMGYISRTPDHHELVQNPYRPESIVVDLYKETLPPPDSNKVVIYNAPQNVYNYYNMTREQIDNLFKRFIRKKPMTSCQ